MASVTFGRSRECDFVIDDFYISRSHCRLQMHPIKPGPGEQGRYRFTLIDSGSPAGTLVNSKRVEHPVDLRTGDSLQIGSVRLAFRILG